MYLVVDLETSCKTVNKRLGNPFHNYILCIGLAYQHFKNLSAKSFIKSDALTSFIPYTKNKVFALETDTPPTGWLQDVTTLIGHNIKYDLLYLWRNEELQESLKNGLTIWDTQLAEYILSGQQHKYPALRDIAVNKYGLKERVKHIEESFKKGIDTTKMDINELLTDVRNDVLDTEAIALQQVKLAKERGMYKLIKAQMDALLATTEIEYNGMYVNLDILIKQKQNVENELTYEYEKLYTIVRRYWK